MHATEFMSMIIVYGDGVFIFSMNLFDHGYSIDIGG